MNRRNALLTLTSAMATTAVMTMPRLVSAQAPTTTTLDHAPYKTNTLQLGTLSKETSMLAVSNAGLPRIRQFAQFEIAEQTTIAQVLTQNNNPPPAPLDAPHAAILKGLQGLSGKPFDIAYVRDQTNVHMELFNLQQEYLNSMPTELDYMHTAMLARTVIQMHMTMLQDLQNLLIA